MSWSGSSVMYQQRQQQQQPRCAVNEANVIIVGR